MISFPFSRKRKRKPVGLAIFIPWDEKELDAVEIAYADCKSDLEADRCHVQKIKSWSPFADQALSEHLSRDNRYIMVFAHFGPASVGLAVSPGRNFAIRAPWWNVETKALCKIAYFRVCAGSALLAQVDWRVLFPSWISYTNRPTYINSARSRNHWHAQTMRVKEILSQSLDSKSAAREIRIDYQRRITRLVNDESNPEDLFTAACMQEAMKGLTSSGPGNSSGGTKNF